MIDSIATSTSPAAPSSVAELCGLVRQAVASGSALYPFGGRTMFDLGGAPSKPGIAVDMRQLNRVIDFPARDMTITVQAGITVATLDDTLRHEKQRLPVDIPMPERATLGGAIAANASGFRRFGHGTLRDYIIGISLMNDEGAEIKGGGRVVKNVAGYDLMKLFNGSLGTLGIITQVTLKLKPLAEAFSVLTLPVTLDQVATILESLGRTRTRPIGLDLLDPQAAGHCVGLGSSWLLVVGFEDNAQSVAWQVGQFRTELPAELQSQLHECSAREREAIDAALRDFQLLPGLQLSFKANMTPGAVPDFCRQASAMSLAPLLQAHAGNGIVHGHVSGTTCERAELMLDALIAVAAKAHGNVVVTRCPADWKAALPLWGRSTADRILMKEIKVKLDPKGIFNPGRFVV